MDIFSKVLESLDITQAEMARELGISRQRLSQYINGDKGTSIEVGLLYKLYILSELSAPEFIELMKLHADYREMR